MNKKLRTSLDVVLYVVVYLLLQFVVHLVGASIYAAVEGVDAQTVLAGMAVGEYGWLLAVEMVVSSGLAIWLFLRLRWAPVSRDYLASKPWTALAWVALLTLGLLLPSQWLYEQLQVSMSEDYQRLFEGILKEPWGYAAIGFLAPLAEEMVFRGAVLRTLLGLFDRRRHWLPIAISALLFALVHWNMAQGLHAFLMGLLIGWMYYRTESIVPGLVLHGVNNSVAYIVYNLMPQAGSGELIDLFQGNRHTLYMALLFSLCILLPSVFQLTRRLKKAAAE